MSALTTILLSTFLYLPLALILLIPILHLLAHLNIFPPYTQFAARTLAAYISLTISALYGVFASLFLLMIGNSRKSQYQTAQSYIFLMRYISQIRFTPIHNAHLLNETRPAVLVGNHQSALDVLLLATIWPKYCSVTAKKSLKYTPFLGWFMTLSNTIFIDRSNRSSAISAFDSAAEEMVKHRQSVFIFPEGTRSNAPGPTMGAFKKGAFHLAIRAQVPILPVVAANYYGVLSLRDKVFRGGNIPVQVLEPVGTKGLGPGDVEALMLRVRETMVEALVEVSGSEEGRRVGGRAAKKED